MLNREIADRVKTLFKMQEKNGHLRGGLCPACEDKFLYFRPERPEYVRCAQTACGYSASTADIFPDIFQNLSKLAPPNRENPQHTAETYLRMVRGFDTYKIRGWYEQANFWRQNADRGTATVRFYLTPDKSIYWERLIDDVVETDPETGAKKTRNKNFKGSYAGLWWQPPYFEIQDLAGEEQGEKVYLVEGIFDAIALNINGFKAVSMMSAGSFPEQSIKPHLGKNVTWVIALDNDQAGERARKKHAKTLTELGEKYAVAISTDAEEKTDWNDLHLKGKLTADHMQRYEQLGAVLNAETKNEKAYYLWFMLNKRRRFVFDFEHHTYSVNIDGTKFEEEASSIDPRPEKRLQQSILAFGRVAEITQIMPFSMRYLYFQQPENGNDGQYYFHLNFGQGKPVNMALPHSVLSASTKFKEILKKEPGAQFKGDKADIDFLYDHWMQANNKRVKTIDFIGYCLKEKAYVYNDYAIQGGRLIKLNKQEFLRLKNTGIKSTFDGKMQLSLEKPVNFLDDFITAFGIGGIITLAAALGSLFAEQVRAQYGRLFFYEIIGDAGSGKSQMVDFISKLFGKDPDEFNPSHNTSAAGLARKLASVSNLPVIVSEADNETEHKTHYSKFSWENWKVLYEGVVPGLKGVKTQDNTYKDYPFRGMLFIVQNIPVQASEAIMSRIVHRQFDRSHHSLKGYEASVRLSRLEKKELSGFLIHTLLKEQLILSTINQQYPKHNATLRNTGTITTQRVMDTHSTLLAFVDCLQIALPEISADIIQQARDEVIKMAIERENVLKRDHAVVEQFWATFDYLNSSAVQTDTGFYVKDHLMNHAAENSDEIAVNLEHFRQRCVEMKMETIDIKELRKYLPTSTKPKFISANTAKHSVIENRTIRCWIFKR